MPNDSPSVEEVLKSIEPRSDQLNSEDCAATGPITVTVKGVRSGSKDQPIIIDLEGHDRPFKPNKTYRRVLIALWSKDPMTWIGQRMTIYTDPTIMFGGLKCGGLCVSHVTGITETVILMLTKTRGKKAEVTIHPIAPEKPEPTAPPTPEEQKYITVATEELEAVETLEQLEAHGQLLKNKSKPIQDALRPVYGKRLKKLEA